MQPDKLEAAIISARKIGFVSILRTPF